jgi:phosphate transport system permease protein
VIEVQKRLLIATLIGVMAMISLVFSLVGSLVYSSIPSILALKSTLFLYYLPAIYGSLVVSIVAILLAMPLATGVAIFISEYLPRKIRSIFISINDLMASFPTIIYGYWGLYELGPFLNSTLFKALNTYLGFIPLFSTQPSTGSYLLASIVLSIMISPFASSLIREVYSKIPYIVDESVYALGLGRWEVIRIKLLYSRRAILGGMTLAFGRGLGETVAVDLTVGGAFSISSSLLSPGITIPAFIANQFGSAFTQLEISSLFALALLLFIIGVSFTLIAKLLILRGER